MSGVIIGKGAMSGRGLYAARNFKKDEVVIGYELKPITFRELKELSPEDYAATHNVNGQIYEGYAKLSLKKYRPIAARNEGMNVFRGLL
jgi:hypothetical protein